jgi:hypothetical protein
VLVGENACDNEVIRSRQWRIGFQCAIFLDILYGYYGTRMAGCVWHLINPRGISHGHMISSIPHLRTAVGDWERLLSDGADPVLRACLCAAESRQYIIYHTTVNRQACYGRESRRAMCKGVAWVRDSDSEPPTPGLSGTGQLRVGGHTRGCLGVLGRRVDPG